MAFFLDKQQLVTSKNNNLANKIQLFKPISWLAVEESKKEVPYCY